MKRLALAFGIALTLATSALVAQQPKAGAPVLTDKQRKNLAALAEPWPDADTIAKRKAEAEGLPLFQSSEPFEFTLKADFKTVQRDRDPSSTTLYPATLTVPGTDGQPVTLEVEIRNRGIQRRNARTCDFPPIRVEFGKADKKDLKRSIFAGFKHVKLATHCRGEYEEYVVREYLAYRTYSLITPWSLRTRLARATYVDDASGKTVAKKHAFFIERDEDLARRMEGRIADLPRTALENHDIDALTRAAIFSFMLGSTDYSIFTLHNVFLVQGQDKKLHTVVYDFDMTGLVNPPYATASRVFHLDSVKQRLYRGPCRPAAELEPLLAPYRANKDAILALYEDQKELNQQARKEMKEYALEFFDIINDKGRTKGWLVDTCNKGVW